MAETEIPTSETQEVLEPTIEDMIQAEDGVPFTTSLVIAQAFDKEHKNVLRDIENLECSPQFRMLNFEHTPYVHPQNGQTYPAYRLTRDGFAFLAMGFTGKKAAVWKERFLEAFNAMEAALLNQHVKEKPHASDNASDKRHLLKSWSNRKPGLGKSPNPSAPPGSSPSLKWKLSLASSIWSACSRIARSNMFSKSCSRFPYRQSGRYAPVRLPPCRLFRDKTDVSDLRQKPERHAGIPSIYRRHRRPDQILEPLFRFYQSGHSYLHSEQMRLFASRADSFRCGLPEGTLHPLGWHFPLRSAAEMSSSTRPGIKL